MLLSRYLAIKSLMIDGEACVCGADGVPRQSQLCVSQSGRPNGNDWPVTGGGKMPVYSPELIATMKAVLNQAVTTLPADQATPSVKAFVAEVILKAAATGETNYDGLLAAAMQHIPSIVSQLL